MGLLHDQKEIAMRRYWISKDCFTPKYVVIKGDDFHHIRDVCRQGKDSKFEVLNGDGLAYFVCVVDERKKEMVAEILETRDVKPLAQPFIHLVLCLPKISVLEDVIEKAVEMGVASLRIAFSDFSHLRGPHPTIQNKAERWNKIVKSATQQSGRGELMPLTEPTSLDKCLSAIEGFPVLFLYEGESQLTIKENLQSLRDKSLNDIAVIIGGEGGFSQREVELFNEKGFGATTLGSQVLRVETAVIAAVSAVKYEFDLMK